jgi:predicted neuraminidase
MMTMKQVVLCVAVLLATSSALPADGPKQGSDFEMLSLSIPSHPQGYLANLGRLADGTILCGYASGENWKLDSIQIITSKDAGKSWTAPVAAMRITRKGYIADVNFLVMENHVTLMATFVPETKPLFGASEFWAAESKDQGKTWSAPRTLKTPHKYCTGKVHAPVRLRDGTWVMGYSWELGAEQGHPAGSEPAMKVKAGMLRSHDNGLTWKPGSDIWNDEPMGPDEPAIVLLKNGDLFAVFRTGGTHPFEGRSTDGGLTWGPLRRSQFEGHNTPTGLLRLKDGSILRLWDHSPKNRYPLVASISRDECATWSAPKTIIEPQRDAGKLSFQTACYPSAVQADDGTIIVTWWEIGDFGSRIRGAKFSPGWVSGAK